MGESYLHIMITDFFFFLSKPVAPTQGKPRALRVSVLESDFLGWNRGSAEPLRVSVSETWFPPFTSCFPPTRISVIRLASVGMNF